MISIIALCVGISSLTWQFALYQLTGPRIRARLKAGTVGPAGMITAPVSSARDAQQKVVELQRDSYGDPILAVEAFNGGRLAAQVLRIGAELSNGVSFVPTRPVGTKTALPCALGPHDEATWAIPFSEVLRVVEVSKAAGFGEGLKLRLFVEVAGGRKIYTRDSIVF